jgi:kynureninase
MQEVSLRSDVEALDTADPLNAFRAQFHLPDGAIYLDGNSLGPMVNKVPAAMEHALQQEWANGLISSWNDAGWWNMAVQLGDRIGQIVGAASGQIVVSDSTSVNLFKALHAALALRPGRKTIVSEAESFPTDLYMIEGAMQAFPGSECRLVGSLGADLDAVLDDQVAVVLLSNVNYRSGALGDMQAITKNAHDAGALVIWDLCHSAGVVPMQLDAWDVDFAVGCTYKYLNGGPGAPSFIYAARRLHDTIRQPLSGWWGHAAPFSFETVYRPAPGIRAFLCGSQPILSMRALEAALGAYDGVELSAIRTKSQKLTGLFIELVSEMCPELGIASPRDPDERGSQVALTHENGYAIVQAMIARGIIGDFRAPDILRFGFAPLYIRYVDVWDAAVQLADILKTEEWREPRFQVRSEVT